MTNRNSLHRLPILFLVNGGACPRGSLSSRVLSGDAQVRFITLNLRGYEAMADGRGSGKSSPANRSCSMVSGGGQRRGSPCSSWCRTPGGPYPPLAALSSIPKYGEGSNVLAISSHSGTRHSHRPARSKNAGAGRSGWPHRRNNSPGTRAAAPSPTGFSIVPGGKAASMNEPPFASAMCA